VRWKKTGVLLPFKPEGIDRIDPSFKDADGTYVGVWVSSERGHRILSGFYSEPLRVRLPYGNVLKTQKGVGVRIRRLDHVQLAMPAGRENDARAFYQGVLGIPEVAKPPQLAARGGCWFEHGDLKVHLGVEADFSPARKAHPAFIVDDLQNLVQRLRDAGHKVD